MNHRAYVAFSGGGAKGVVHVGAVKALEDRSVNLVGLSGTSAGAIVASLIAAGFKSNELINSETERTILDSLNKIDPRFRSAKDIFGKGGWRKIRLLRFFLRLPAPALILICLLVLVPLLVTSMAALLTPRWPFVLIAAIAVMAAFLCRLYSLIVGGLADVQDFRDGLSKLVQQKMFPSEPDRIVRMKDFGANGVPNLKIVSANLSKRTLHLFSAERTPETPVADAVAASVCLPVIFRPWIIDGELHMDGGIVSNLPAWPFDEERELDPEALTIAVSIIDSPAKGKLGRLNWIPSAIRTGLFGSAELNLRVAGPAEHLAIPTTFNLFDFDKSAAAAAQEVRDVAGVVGLRLDGKLFRLPQIYRDACEVAQAIALDSLSLTPGGTGSAPRVRVAVGRLERGYSHSLRLSYSVGFEDDADEFMLVPLAGSVAGAAWLAGRSLLEEYPLKPYHDLPGVANRLRRKSRWAGLSWVMCIPIVDESNRPRLLVHIDGNTALPPANGSTTPLDVVEAVVKDFFGIVLRELKELEDSNA